MFKVFIVSVLLLLSIFCGLYPASEGSPHNYIAKYFGYEEEIHYTLYILIGIVFYVLAAFLSQQKSVDKYW
tara:strand:- start:531 stop:743 length:213 start_codon:yes stop_codon:yes gene_type:complete